MLIQRDRYISFEPTRLITYGSWRKYNPSDLTEEQMMELVREGVQNCPELAGERIKRETGDVRDENLIRSNAYNGWLSAAAARSMRSVLMNWTQAVELSSNKKALEKERIYPILLTLTLPSTQLISDYDAKLCLEKFLALLNREEDTRYEREKRLIMFHKDKVERKRKLEKALKRHQKALRKYLWRAEPQQNGNIHFHLVIDHWIDKDEVRQRWNTAIEEHAGLISQYQNVQKYEHQVVYPVYVNKKTVWATAPSQYQSGKPFVYGGYRFKLDEVAKKAKLSSIRERISKSISLQKMGSYLIDEGSVLGRLFKEAIRTKKMPSTKVLERAAEQLQVDSFCRAVDNDFTDPPTTRIESMRDKQSVAAYLAKYLAKPTVKEVREKVDLEKEAQKPGYEWVYGHLFDDQDNEVLPEKVTIITEGRRLHGRIWGKSRSLNQVKDFGFFKVTESSITSFHGMVETGEETKITKTVTKQPTKPDLFGYVEYHDVVKEHRSIRTLYDYKKATGTRLVEAAEPFYHAVKDFIGTDGYWQDTPEDRNPNVTIIKFFHRINKNAKDGEEKKKATIIAYNQLQMMKRFSPELYQAYQAHYYDLFYSIYNWDHHVKDGSEKPTYVVPTDHRIQFMPRLLTTVHAA